MQTQFVINIPKTENPFVARFNSTNGKKFDRNDFWRFCQENPELRLEQTATGEIIVMPPTGGISGNRNFNLNGRFYQWMLQNKQGLAFDSSTVFELPNGAQRSPDLSWVKSERWNQLTREQQDKFPPLCPDFVMELRSRTDRLKELQAKMREYIENGAQLGWLIDPLKNKVHVYRPNAEPEVLDQPNEVSGEPLLSGFVLELKDFWE